MYNSISQIYSILRTRLECLHPAGLPEISGKLEKDKKLDLSIFNLGRKAIHSRPL